MSHSRFGLLCRKIITSHMRRCARWDQTSTVNASKVTLNLMSDHIEHHIMIKSFSQTGFLLNNDDIRVIGPAVFFPREVLHWNIKDVNDINEASLSLFTLLDPKVDILLLGLGHRAERLSQEAMNYLKGNKINYEILTTEKACALFNFLNGEKRQVAAAMVPPEVIEDSMIVPIDEDTIKFPQDLDLFDYREKLQDFDPDKTFNEYMLDIPSQKVRESKAYIEELIKKRKKALDMVRQRPVEEIMNELEKDEREKKEKKAEMEMEKMKVEMIKEELEREKSGQPDRDRLKTGGKVDREKTNPDKDSDDSKS